jgi:uncharacterized membrane protein HdeD (DUF308 family)
LTRENLLGIAPEFSPSPGRCPAGGQPAASQSSSVAWELRTDSAMTIDSTIARTAVPSYRRRIITHGIDRLRIKQGITTMTALQSDDARQLREALGAAVRRHWVVFLSEGIVLVVLGMLALLAPAIASVAATVFFGWILLLSGVAGLIATLRARRAPGFWWSLLSALVGIVAGLLLLGWPLQGTLSLTAVLIAFLLVEGGVTVMYALEHRAALSGRWGWMLASGILDVALGVLLFVGLPGTALWALGLLVGLNMLFGGWALIVMALHARRTAPGAPV